jgi:hypothetical protein
MATVRDLLRDVRPSGDVYLNDPRFPLMLRIHKTSFIATLEKTDPDKQVGYELRNPEGTGIYSKPRRKVVLHSNAQAKEG